MSPSDSAAYANETLLGSGDRGADAPWTTLTASKNSQGDVLKTP